MVFVAQLRRVSLDHNSGCKVLTFEVYTIGNGILSSNFIDKGVTKYSQVNLAQSRV
jgi:hypothetical protein